MERTATMLTTIENGNQEDDRVTDDEIDIERQLRYKLRRAFREEDPMKTRCLLSRFVISYK